MLKCYSRYTVIPKNAIKYSLCESIIFFCHADIRSFLIFLPCWYKFLLNNGLVLPWISSTQVIEIFALPLNFHWAHLVLLPCPLRYVEKPPKQKSLGNASERQTVEGSMHMSDCRLWGLTSFAFVLILYQRASHLTIKQANEQRLNIGNEDVGVSISCFKLT